MALAFSRLMVIFAVLVAAGVAAAQPDPYEIFYKGTLREALDESKERHRVLVVYIGGRNEDSQRMNTVTWTNPVVAAWITTRGGWVD